jgi:hypothetical protein
MALDAQYEHQYLGVVLHHALTALLDAFCILRGSCEGARALMERLGGDCFVYCGAISVGEDDDFR